MTRHDSAILTIRGFAVYAWFLGLQHLLSNISLYMAGLAYAYRSFSVPGGVDNILSIFIVPVAEFWVGFFLFKYSQALASKLIPAPAGEPVAEATPQPLYAVSVGFALLGVYLFATAIPTIVMAAIAISSATRAMDQAAVQANYTPRIYGAVAEMVIGFALFLKAGALASAWWRKQQAPGK